MVFDEDGNLFYTLTTKTPVTGLCTITVADDINGFYTYNCIITVKSEEKPFIKEKRKAWQTPYGRKEK